MSIETGGIDHLRRHNIQDRLGLVEDYNASFNPLLKKFKEQEEKDVLFVKNDSRIYEDGGYRVAVFADLFDRTLCVDSKELFENPELLLQEFRKYFKYCFDNQLIPSFTSACLFVGTNINNVCEMYAKYPDIKPIFDRVQKTLHSLRESLALENRVSTNYAMWLDKNLEGFSDKMSIVTDNYNHTVEISPEEKQDIIDMLPDE